MDTEKILYIVSLLVFSWEYLRTLLTSKEFGPLFAGALWQIGHGWDGDPQKFAQKSG